MRHDIANFRMGQTVMEDNSKNSECDANSQRPVENEGKRQRRRNKRMRLHKMIYAIKRAIPDHFARTHDTEYIAEMLGVIRADVQDRTMANLEHRVRLLEAWRSNGCNDPIERKDPERETTLSVVPRKIA